MPSTIRDLTELTAVAVDDYFLVSDTSDVTNRDKRISQANLLGAAALRTGTPILNRVATWANGTTLQDSTVSILDMGRLSVAQTYTGLMTGAGGYRTGGTTINNLSFFQFPAPSIAGMALFWCTNSPTAYGMIFYRNAAYISSVFMGATMNMLNGPLTGSSGVSGRATIGMSGTDMYLENQLGSARSFAWMFFV